MNMYKHIIILLSLLFLMAPMIDAAPFVYITTATVPPSSVETVVVIDAATNAIVATIPIPGANDIQGIAITPDNNFAYVASHGTNAIYVLNLTTNTVAAGPITTGIGNEPYSVTITPNGAYALIATSSSVSIVSTAINAAIAGSPFATPFTTPLGITISPDGNTAYVLDNGTNEILPLNISNLPAAPTSEPVIHVGTGIGITAFAITSDGNTGYAINATDQKIYPITNLKTSPSVGTGIFVPDCGYLVLTPDNRFAYVVPLFTYTNSFLTLVNLTTSSIVDEVEIGGISTDIGITADGSKVYVPTALPNTVSAFYTTSNMEIPGTPIVLDTKGPRFIAISTLIPPPFSATATIKKNIFLDKTERIFTLSWTADTDADVASYNIFNGQRLVGCVLATCPLTFTTVLADCDNGENFSITAVGNASASVPVAVAC